MCVILMCIAQMSWMKNAQSQSLIMWVQSSLEETEPGQPPLRHAILPEAEVLPSSPDECADALQLPKVALMFLTMGHLHHEDTWRMWFRSAAGVLPAQTVAASVCNAEGGTNTRVLSAARACKRNSTDAIAAQHLFSVYIHAPPDFEGYGKDSLWDGHLVRHRITTAWGAHTLVEATRHLVWEAFRDPLNTRFMLLSESDIPLYDPLTLYQQAQGERTSRLDTCKHQKTSQWRWDPRMEVRGVDGGWSAVVVWGAGIGIMDGDGE